MGLADFEELTHLDRPDLLYPPITPRVPPEIRSARSITSAIRKGDILLYHPFDSFSPVVEFVRAAANDPEVLAIKQTLYRVGSNSPIVEALSEARDEQTQVAVLVELKARFDEEPNITWARQLEARGVHVAYGIVGLKTHAKICLVVRREGSGLRRYVHMGTGNYNPSTARIYTDFSYFTDDPEHSRGRLGSVQLPDRVLRAGGVPRAVRRAPLHARRHHRRDRGADGQSARGREPPASPAR